MIRSLFAISR